MTVYVFTNGVIHTFANWPKASSFMLDTWAYVPTTAGPTWARNQPDQSGQAGWFVEKTEKVPAEHRTAVLLLGGEA